MHTAALSGPRCCRNRRRPSRRPASIKWLRENLFSSWVNAILTIVSLYVIYWVISHICRLDAERHLGRGQPVGMPRDPGRDLWRRIQCGLLGRPDGPLGPADVRVLPIRVLLAPVLALILFLVAMSPVLYDTLPRKMLLFTAISPFVLFWLLWGGTIWGRSRWRRASSSVGR
jgi:general L-amino acid transport system permease protein